MLPASYHLVKSWFIYMMLILKKEQKKYFCNIHDYTSIISDTLGKLCMYYNLINWVLSVVFLIHLSVTPHTQCRLKLLKQERIKDYLLMEEEFIRNQEQMKPLEEKQEVSHCCYNQWLTWS